MHQFKMIPLVDSTILPDEVRNELYEWNDEITLHYDDKVLYLGPEEVSQLPKLVAFMVELGAWSKDQVTMTTYEEFCAHNDLNPTGEPYHFDKFFDAHGEQRVEVALMGS